MKKILIVDDEENILYFTSQILRKKGYSVDTAYNGEEALAKLAEENNFQVILTDIKMPKMDGITLLKKVKMKYPNIIFLVMTAYGTIDIAVEAIKSGATDFITKPLDIEKLLKILDAVINTNTPIQEEKLSVSDFFIGKSLKMQKVYKQIKQVAALPTTVIILGESGTGKELAAKSIHYLSDRRSKPFVAFNCAAVPETMIESELFGHEKGAFTGAIAKQLGRFEMANRGTLFIDEIGDMSLAMQAKLLRVLQEKTLERIGGKELIKLNVRIIAATNKDLEEAIKKNQFRADLFYRLNIFPIYLPPLRERREDIPLLIEYFLDKFTAAYHKTISHSPIEITQMLEQYDWPGNVRELENIVESLVITAEEGKICLTDIPHNIFNKLNKSEEKSLFKSKSKGFEKEVIADALINFQGNRKMTAEHLGIGLRSLQYKIKEYNLK